MIRDFISRELLLELIAKHLGVAAVSLAWEVDAGKFKGATIIATIEFPVASLDQRKREPLLLLDQVYRFMEKNPKASAEMLREIEKKSPQEEE